MEQRIKTQNILGYSWARQIGDLLFENDGKETAKKVNARRKVNNVYPSRSDTFRAFRLTSFEDTRVVIIGQQPYSEADLADGLAFSTQDPFETPLALENILNEVKKSCYVDQEFTILSKDLSVWAEQGVLLINKTLTVDENADMSHEEFGWDNITRAAIAQLIDRKDPVVFLLWGMNAKNLYLEAKTMVTGDDKHHLTLDAAHPSAIDGFEDCDHFNKANEFLKQRYGKEVSW